MDTKIKSQRNSVLIANLFLGVSLGVAIAVSASLATAAGVEKRFAPVFPIQSFSSGAADDVWIIRSNSTIEYCRSEQRNDFASAAAIQCYPQEQPNGYRFASVDAVKSSTAYASAYAMTISGELVFCRVRDKQGNKLNVSCHQ